MNEKPNDAHGQRTDGWNDAPEPLAEILRDETLTPRERVLLTEALFVHDSDAAFTAHPELIA